MGIFNNNSLDLRIREIYDLDSITPIAYKSLNEYIGPEITGLINKHWPNCDKAYDLCTITNPDYGFLNCVDTQWHNTTLTTKEFTERCINAFRDCPIGGITKMSEYINEHCGIPDREGSRGVYAKTHIDIIHDIKKSCNYHTITKNWTYDQTKTYRVGIGFPYPYPYDRQKDNFMSCSWAIIYRYIEDTPGNIHLIIFPLVPKEGCIDAFNMR